MNADKGNALDYFFGRLWIGIYLVILLALIGASLLSVSATRAASKVAAATPTLVVNANQVLHAVTHVAAGGLYGLGTDATPPDSLVTPLHPKEFVQMAPGGKQLPNGESTPAGTTVLSVANYTITNGSITVPITGMVSTSGYRIQVTPTSTALYDKIINKNSGLLLGITDASTTAGAQALQWSDNGTADHLWQLVDAGGGYVKIVNKNSGLLLGITNASTASGAIALQWTDNSTADHLWQIQS